MTTFLGSRQIETIIAKYTQAATELDSVKGWWVSLSAREQTEPDAADRLVEQTESILQKEHADWIKKMEDAMAELQAEQEDEKPAS